MSCDFIRLIAYVITSHHANLSKLSKHWGSFLTHCIISGKADNAVEAPQFINSIITNPVSPQTVRKTKSAQLKAVVKKKQPLLPATHRKRRLAFALKYQKWSVEGWKHIMWSDKMKINRIGSEGQEYIWKKAREQAG